MLLALTTLLGLAWLLPCIHAQTFKPSGLPNPINSYIDKQALFIAGGYRNSSTGPRMTQLFAIDLSVSWDSSDPTFKKLPDSPLLYYGPSTISADGKQWIVVDNSTAYAYDIEKATWSTLVQHDLTVVDQIAATDPDTGFIYIPATNNNYLMRLNVTSRSYDRLIINKNVSETNDFSAAWSAFQKKLFIIGGRHGADNPTQLIMFSYNDTAGWANLTMDAKGEVPGPRHSACLVPAFGGKKMVLFGGKIGNTVNALADIYVLDVATMFWTRGPDVAQTERRALAACAVSNDHFMHGEGRTDLSGIRPSSSTSIPTSGRRLTRSHLARQWVIMAQELQMVPKARLEDFPSTPPLP